MQSLPSGIYLEIYQGCRYTADALLEIDWNGRHGRPTHPFALSDGTTIDGASGGNDLRFLNHVCPPNCEAAESYDVAVGSELPLGYGLIIDERESTIN